MRNKLLIYLARVYMLNICILLKCVRICACSLYKYNKEPLYILPTIFMHI